MAPHNEYPLFALSCSRAVSPKNVASGLTHTFCFAVLTVILNFNPNSQKKTSVKVWVVCLLLITQKSTETGARMSGKEVA